MWRWKKLKDQYNTMKLFSHGKELTHPSQIVMIANAVAPYNLPYNKIMSTATRKKDNMETISHYELKDSVTFDSSRSYISGEDITFHDLEKNRTGGQLLSGRPITRYEKTRDEVI